MTSPLATMVGMTVPPDELAALTDEEALLATVILAARLAARLDDAAAYADALPDRAEARRLRIRARQLLEDVVGRPARR